jgi:hypothetical protein
MGCRERETVEITPEMYAAGREAHYRNSRFEGDAGSDVMLYAIFRDMARASPQLRQFRVVDGAGPK